MKKLLTIFIILSLAFTGISYSEEFFPAKARDISDRNYESAVIELLDNAQESIVISMYMIKPSKKGPVYLLLNDLVEALGRGVEVDIYLNTRKTYDVTFQKDLNLLKELLVDKGARIHEMDSNYRLHDKLIIVDSRFVVEGSTNWSVTALKDNLESCTVIDSPPLAKIKLERIKNLPLEIDKYKKPDNWIGVAEVPSLEVKTALLEDERYLPRLVSRDAARAMTVYLLLLRESLNWKTQDSEGNALSFPVSLEDLASDLGLDHFDEETQRGRMRKVLRLMDTLYGLINVEFFYNRDAMVILKDIPGDTFTVDISFFDPKHLNSISSRVKFLLLIQNLLESRGESLDDYSIGGLAAEFHVSRDTIKKGLGEVGMD